MGSEMCIRDRPDGAIISIGSCDGAVRETRDQLEAEGIRLDYMRLRAFPFGETVRKFLDTHDRIFVVEQNRDAQLRSLLITETNTSSEELIPVLYYGGQPISCKDIVDPIAERIRKEKAA